MNGSLNTYPWDSNMVARLVVSEILDNLCEKSTEIRLNLCVTLYFFNSFVIVKHTCIHTHHVTQQMSIFSVVFSPERIENLEDQSPSYQSNNSNGNW